ncbi:DUF2384 domain-containing protein [Arthrobacter sp. LjRoot78]|uniref:hypothetical protein n=1 Tax=Arthrobacter sp. LjRoot78 TaxID=3342338 RepID=UPI003ED13378
MDSNNDVESPEPVPGQETSSREAAEAMWRFVHAEFGLLTSQEMALQLGIADPDDVRRLYSEGRLVAIHRGGRVLYPGFQIDPESRTILPVFHDLLRAAEEAVRHESAMISWLVRPSSSLDGARPVDLLDDPERILAEARTLLNAGS